MGKRMVILGAAESGVGAAVLAQKKGFDVFVSDMGKIKPHYVDMLDRYGIAWEDGGHTEELVLNADEVIKSPGIPEDAPMVLKVKAAGIPIISEIEFAGRYTHAKMICITGSNYYVLDLSYLQESGLQRRVGRKYRPKPGLAGGRERL